MVFCSMSSLVQSFDCSLAGRYLLSMVVEEEVEVVLVFPGEQAGLTVEFWNSGQLLNVVGIIGE